jgi:aspartyl/asparaginyl-tRNA synthetase
MKISDKDREYFDILIKKFGKKLINFDDVLSAIKEFYKHKSYKRIQLLIAVDLTYKRSCRKIENLANDLYKEKQESKEETTKEKTKVEAELLTKIYIVRNYIENCKDFYHRNKVSA